MNFLDVGHDRIHIRFAPSSPGNAEDPGAKFVEIEVIPGVGYRPDLDFMPPGCRFSEYGATYEVVQATQALNVGRLEDENRMSYASWQYLAKIVDDQSRL